MNKRLKISYNAPITLSFVFLCFAVTMLGILSQGMLTTAFFMTFRGSAANPLTYLRLFTHVLGHSGFSHFLGNAMYLLLLGPMLEEKYGAKTMLQLIVITALITGVVHCLLFANVGLCGASGVVFAFIVLSSFTAFKDGEIPLSFIAVVLLFVGQEVYEGLFIQDNVSNLTHVLGGFVGGGVGYGLNKKRRY